MPVIFHFSWYGDRWRSTSFSWGQGIEHWTRTKRISSLFPAMSNVFAWQELSLTRKSIRHMSRYKPTPSRTSLRCVLSLLTTSSLLNWTVFRSLQVLGQMPYFRRSGGRDHIFVFPRYCLLLPFEHPKSNHTDSQHCLLVDETFLSTSRKNIVVLWSVQWCWSSPVSLVGNFS